MSLTIDDIKKLKSPFDEKTLGIKVQSFSKDGTKAMLVAYLQHTDVYDRIEQVDPAWSCETGEVIVTSQGVNVRMKMTIKGVTRENVGEGDDEKSAYSDAIKRCAMLFGVGRYLYDSEQAWVPYDKVKDKFRTFTLAEYQRALRGTAKLPVGPANEPPPANETKKSREVLTAEILKAKAALGMTKVQLDQYIAEDFSGKKAPELTTPEMEKLLESLQREIGAKGDVA